MNTVVTTGLPTLLSSVLRHGAVVYYDRLLFRTVIIIASNLFFEEAIQAPMSAAASMSLVMEARLISALRIALVTTCCLNANSIDSVVQNHLATFQASCGKSYQQ